jgi:hypothetical protein
VTGKPKKPKHTKKNDQRALSSRSRVECISLRVDKDVVCDRQPVSDEHRIGINSSRVVSPRDFQRNRPLYSFVGERTPILVLPFRFLLKLVGLYVSGSKLVNTQSGDCSP